MKRIAITILAAFLLVGASGPAVFAGSVTSEVSAASVRVGDMVTVNGTFDPLVWVTIRVIDSKQSIVVFDAVKSDAAGTYSFTFQVPATAANGSLMVLTGSGSQVASKTIALPLQETGGGGGSTVIGGDNNGTLPPATVNGGDVQVKSEVKTGADGITVATAIVDDEAIAKALAASPAKVTITVSAPATADRIAVQVSPESIRLALVNEATLEIVTDLGTYALPIGVLDMVALTRDLGTTADKVKLIISLNKATAAQTGQVKGAATQLGASLLSDLIDFQVLVEFDGSVVEVRSFGTTYVDRTIPLGSNDIDADKTTGVILSSNGELRFVPSIFTKNDQGSWTATLKRNSNSLYTVASMEKSFTDLTSHWSREAVEKLASKLIVQGVSATQFAPEDTVTRAQFTTLLVRALGLDDAEARAFTDIPSGEWYSGTVAAAYEAKLVSGYEDGSFRPGKPITRQELAVLLSNALTAIGKSITIANADQMLAGFADRADIAEWAKSATAQLVSAGITDGKAEGLYEPLSLATRAEAAVMIERLLKKAQFIN